VPVAERSLNATLAPWHMPTSSWWRMMLEGLLMRASSLKETHEAMSISLPLRADSMTA
jgi:hypothetical protein